MFNINANTFQDGKNTNKFNFTLLNLHFSLFKYILRFVPPKHLVNQFSLMKIYNAFGMKGIRLLNPSDLPNYQIRSLIDKLFDIKILKYFTNEIKNMDFSHDFEKSVLNVKKYVLSARYYVNYINFIAPNFLKFISEQPYSKAIYYINKIYKNIKCPSKYFDVFATKLVNPKILQHFMQHFFEENVVFEISNTSCFYNHSIQIIMFLFEQNILTSIVSNNRYTSFLIQNEQELEFVKKHDLNHIIDDLNCDCDLFKKMNSKATNYLFKRDDNEALLIIKYLHSIKKLNNYQFRSNLKMYKFIQGLDQQNS